MVLGHANCFVDFIEHQFSINTTAPNLNSTVATSTTVSAPPPLPEEDTSLAFLDIKILIKVRNKSEWNY